MATTPRGNPPPVPPRTTPPPVNVPPLSSVSSHPLMPSPSTSPPKDSQSYLNFNNNKNTGSAPTTPRGRGGSTSSARNSVNFSEVSGDIFYN